MAAESVSRLALVSATAALLLLLAPLSASAQAAAPQPVVLTRYEEPVEVMCLSRPPNLDVDKLLARARKRMAAQGAGSAASRSLARQAAARAASVWDTLGAIVDGEQLFGSSQTLMVGAAATIQNASTICTPALDVQLFSGGAFTPYELPPAVATTAWQASFWRSTSPVMSLSIANAVPRSLMVELNPQPIELDPTSGSNLLGPQSQSTAQVTAPYFNQTYSTMSMVNAYFAKSAQGLQIGRIFGAVLVQAQPDATLDGVHYVVAYVMGVVTGDVAEGVARLLGVSVPPVRFAVFQASFFVPSSGGRRRLLGGSGGGGAGRKLKYYYGSGTDSSHSGACASGTCTKCRVAPPGCVRGARTWPGCDYCCYCV